MKMFALAGFVAVAVSAPLIAQGPKPGPELDVLKKHVGDWTFTMKFGGMEATGTASNKMELGGLWLCGTFECELFGQKFHGRGMDTYDANKKKYYGIWVDSMGSAALIMEGTYDAAKKTMTMEGTGPGMDGKPQKYKSVTVTPDDDTIDFTMYVGGKAEPEFTIQYKRKK